MISRKNKDNFLLSNEGTEFIIVSTNKPIMGVQLNIIDNSFNIVYMTQDKVVEKESKDVLVKEYLGGISNLKDMNKLLKNNISILDFMDQLSEKKQAVRINSKLLAIKKIDSFNDHHEYLPITDIYLDDMPIETRTPFNKLIRLITNEIDIETRFRFFNAHNETDTKRDSYERKYKTRDSEDINNYHTTKQISVGRRERNKQFQIKGTT